MSETPQLIAALVVALLPGLFNIFLGRKLRAVDDEATLPERLTHLRQWLVPPILVSLAGLAWLVADRLILYIPLMIAALLLGGFKTRKEVFRETWGPFAYLNSTVRVFLAFHGLTTVLSIAPWLIYLSDPNQVSASLMFLIGLIAWSCFSHRCLLWFLQSRPVDAELREKLARAESSLRAPSPAVFLAAVGKGGSWANAFALPHSKRPRVVLSRALVDLLDDDELVAIYAHEIAHLEHFDRKRVLMLQALTWGLIWLGTAFAWLVVWFAVIWPFFVSYALGSLNGYRRRWENDADARAVALSGDADALQRALVKMHRGVAPRRVSIAMEETSTHPSLARRLQAIRRVGGARPPALDPVVVRGAASDAAVVLEADRMHWLSGIDGDAATAGDPALSLERARSGQMIAYDRLVELRVDRKLTKAPVLLATSVEGETYSLRLPTDSTAVVQDTLDRVDHLLAEALSTEGKKKYKKSEGSGTMKSLLLWILIFSATVVLWTIFRG